MASREMTFTLPEPLAAQFVKTVPARNRSRYLAEALAFKMTEREQQLIRSCEIANQEPDVLAVEAEFGAITDEMLEPWTDVSSGFHFR